MFNFLKRLEAVQLIVCLAYNETYDFFSPVFFALLESKNEETYTRLHQSIMNISNDRFNLGKWTLDFEQAHINVKTYYF